MKKFISIIKFLFFSVLTFAQNNSEIFDQKLADSLNADERGMKTYMLVILKTGPKDKEITDKKKETSFSKDISLIWKPWKKLAN